MPMQMSINTGYDEWRTLTRASNKACIRMICIFFLKARLFSYIGLENLKNVLHIA
jgi:hypothetical protein